MRTGATVNPTTTMTMNTVLKSLLTLATIGTIATATPTMIGSVRYAKVKSAGLNVEILKGDQSSFGPL